MSDLQNVQDFFMIAVDRLRQAVGRRQPLHHRLHARAGRCQRLRCVPDAHDASLRSGFRATMAHLTRVRREAGCAQVTAGARSRDGVALGARLGSKDD